MSPAPRLQVTAFLMVTLLLPAAVRAADEPNTLTEAEAKEGWKLLFDGKSIALANKGGKGVGEKLVGIVPPNTKPVVRVKNPDATDRYVALRGFSWIAEPTPDGVVIAIEIPMGAAVAGPFDISQPELDRLITRVLAAAHPRSTVH